MLIRLRHWIIRVLAGKLAVVLNVEIRGKLVVARPGSLVWGVQLTPVEGVGAGVWVAPEAMSSKGGLIARIGNALRRGW